MRRVWVMVGALITVGLIGGYLLRSDLLPAQVTQAATDEAPGVSATAYGLVDIDPAAQPGTLNVSVQQQSLDRDLQAAVKDVQAKVAAIQTALQKAGVPAGNIHIGGLNVSASPGPRPLPAMPPLAEPPGGAPGAPGVTVPAPVPAPVPVPPSSMPYWAGFMVSQTLQADVTGSEQLVAAVLAATQAGAISVNTFNKGGPQGPPPDAAVLAPAIEQATKQAQAMAQQSARAAGLSLGGLRATSVQPPMFMGTGPGTGSWRVAVTLTYNVRA